MGVRHRVPLAGLAVAVVAAAQTGVVAGRVVDAGSGAGIPGARVELSETITGPDGLTATAVSDAEGGFSFDGVPAGRWTLFAQQDGYSATGATRKAFAVAPGERWTDFAIRLTRQGTIAGVVRDEDGEPIPWASVEARAWRRGSMEWATRNSGLTQADGSYRVRVGPGRYVLRATANHGGHRRISPETSVAKFIAREEHVGRRFYRNTGDEESAEPIEVGAGEEIAGIDFRLPVEPNVKLTVRVKLQEGMTGEFVTIATASGDRSWAWRADGKPIEQWFEPGRYALVAKASMGERTLVARRALTIAGEAPMEVTIDAFDVAPDLRGRIRVKGAARESKFAVVLKPKSRAEFQEIRAEAAADGTFVLPKVAPGAWAVRVEPAPRGGYVESIRMGGQDLLDRDLEVAGDPRAPIEIVVVARGGTIAGKAPAETGKVVVAQPAANLFRDAIPGADGSFRVDGLRPGEYMVYAFDWIEDDEWLDAAFYKPFAERGVKVTVKEGGAVEATPPLIAR